MTGNQLFDEHLLNLLRIGPSEKNIELYHEMKESFKDIEILDFFQQFKKNDHGDGLALEIMFFDINLVHDIVFTKTTIEHSTVIINNISSVNLNTSFGETKNDKDELLMQDILTFSISITGDDQILTYITDIKKFTEINRIKNNLLKTRIK